MRKLLAFGLAWGLSTLVGAQGGDTAGQATRHVAVINAGVDSAEVNADMLEAISRNPNTYDEAHGRLFARNIDQALKQAREHLEHLAPLATTPTQKDQVREIEQRLQRASDAAKRLDSEARDPARMLSTAREIDRELDDVDEPLERLARSLNVRIDV